MNFENYSVFMHNHVFYKNTVIYFYYLYNQK